jgi:hypothetical protein
MGGRSGMFAVLYGGPKASRIAIFKNCVKAL